MSPERISKETQELLQDKWTAVVDDTRDFSEGVVLTLVDVYGLPERNVQAFKSCEGFIPRSGDFDLCLLDGRFAPGEMTGPEAVPEIRAENPSIFIVGMSGDDEMSAELDKVGVDLNIDKSQLKDTLPQILEMLSKR